MKALDLHNFVAPCLSNIHKDNGQLCGRKGERFLNPKAIYRYQPDGVVVTIPTMSLNALYLDKDLAESIEGYTVSLADLSEATYQVLEDKGLLLDNCAGGKYIESHCRVSNLPYYAILELTHRCQCKCATCYHWSDLDNYHPKKKDILNRIDSLKRLGVSMIEVSGGEPFLRDDLAEILNYISLSSVFFTVVTNGELMGRARDRLLWGLTKAVSVIVSLDGAEDRHDTARRRSGLYKQIIEGAKYLSANGVKINFIFTVTEENIIDLPKAIELAETVQGKISVRPAKIVGAALENKIKSLTYRALLPYMPHPVISNGFAGNQKDSFEAKFHGCAMPVKISVDARGNIHPCVMDRDLVIGQIEKISPEGLSANLHEISQKYLNNPWCKECKINENGLVCAGVCRFARKFQSKQTS